MADVNKMIILGRIGGDPELKTTPSGAKVCNFSVATNEKWKDKSGNLQERVEWHSIVVWGNQAESCAKYLKKGHQVYVDGRKQTRTWEKDGHKFSGVDIVADQVTFLDNREGGARSDKDSGSPPARGGSANPDDAF